MLFNSYIFIFLFFPCVLAGYFGLNHFGKYTAANVFLIGMSLWFYGYYNPKYLFVIVGSILVNYALSRAMLTAAPRAKKALLAAGVTANVACIFVFKYYDFFTSSINSAFHTSFTLLHIALPLGISFYTFQQIAYLVDSYRGKTKDYTFIEYALFVVFFPQLIAGPIVQHQEMIPQFRDVSRRKWNSEKFAYGLYIFALGLFKKVLLADTFATLVTKGYANIAALTCVEAILVSLAYTFQLYFDFSGYCDMAIGIGSMMNIELPQNFNSPYKADSITDFWARWHMTLTRFLREYIYFPLGGSWNGKLRTYVNIMVVFLISGLWHGANWTFVLWGALHGVANCISRAVRPVWQKVWKPIRWLVTFLTVNVLWVFFRADSVGDALLLLQRMTDFKSIKPALWMNLNLAYKVCFDTVEFTFLENMFTPLRELMDSVFGMHLRIYFAAAFLIVLLGKNSKEIKFKPTVARALLTVILLSWSILSLSGLSEFLYFDF